MVLSLAGRFMCYFHLRYQFVDSNDSSKCSLNNTQHLLLRNSYVLNLLVYPVPLKQYN